VAGVFGLAGLLVGLNAGGPPGARGDEAASVKAQTADVTLKELTISPSTIRLEAARPAVLRVHNTGQALHSLVVDLGGRTVSTSLLGAGQSESLRLPALAAGSLAAWCGVPGHRAAGMTATIEVGGATGGTGGTGGATAMAGMSQMSATAMAAGHEQSMAAFPAKTAGQGARVLAPTLDHGVKVFQLVASPVRWEVAPGQFQQAFAYNGTVPGPELRVRRGDRIRVVVTNRLGQPTTVHFHGMTVPNAADGVPYVTQPPILPGQRFTYAFTVTDPPGTYLCHSHFNSAEQVGRGLFGPVVVEAATRGWDVEYTELISDGPLGYAINGKGWPATAPLLAKRGQRVLIRLANAGELLHPFHLHGFHFLVLAKDGAAERAPYQADTLVVAPGERYDVLVRATDPGVWAFHCHILSHVKGPQGMFGMATALIVK
jgi:FtsP/CotA-like multicopper oxidase with cupredoxin domain